jgi:hypothetical protein
MTFDLLNPPTSSSLNPSLGDSGRIPLDTWNRYVEDRNIELVKGGQSFVLSLNS